MDSLKPISELVSLRGKRALITGAAVGIGSAISCRFAEAGAALELVDINIRGLSALKEELLKYKVEIHNHRVDLSQKSAIDSLWQRLSGKEPDILVNNAGVYPFKKFLDWCICPV